jgi:hypothetical protein
MGKHHHGHHRHRPRKPAPPALVALMVVFPAVVIAVILSIMTADVRLGGAAGGLVLCAGLANVGWGAWQRSRERERGRRALAARAAEDAAILATLEPEAGLMTLLLVLPRTDRGWLTARIAKATSAHDLLSIVEIDEMGRGSAGLVLAALRVVPGSEVDVRADAESHVRRALDEIGARSADVGDGDLVVLALAIAARGVRPLDRPLEIARLYDVVETLLPPPAEAVLAHAHRWLPDGERAFDEAALREAFPELVAD